MTDIVETQRAIYTAAQAEKLLAYVETKLPGLLSVAERTLREHDMWPEEDAEDDPNAGLYDTTGPYPVRPYIDGETHG